MRTIATILTILISTTVFGQTSMSFYHLGRATFQNSSLNPAWIPEGRLFIGLPVLSGVHIHANTKLSYNKLFIKENNTPTIDYDKAISNLQRQNLTSVHAKIELFHIAFKTPTKATFSLFASERVEADALYPRKLVRLAFQGNNALLDEKIKIGKVGFKATHFREIGIGFAAPVNAQIDFGIRAKYLMGFFDASLPGNVKATITSDTETFAFDGQLKNARLRTSGVDIYDETEGDLGSHLLSSGNTGFAIDLGAEYKLNRYYSVAGSLLDVGFINWKTNVVNHTLSDSTFTYGGVDLRDLGDLRESFEDSLFDRFNVVETNESYKSWLPVKAYASWIYHYSKYLDFYGTVGTRLIQSQFKMLYGGGMTLKLGKVFTGSLNAIKMPQQFFNLGAAFAVNGGPVQWYVAADQIINFSVPDARAIDVRFGINLKFRGRDTSLGSRSSVTTYGKKGGSDDGTLEGSKGISTGAFLGRKVKTKKRDEIYSIIPRQKPREVLRGGEGKKKVTTESISGRTERNTRSPKNKITRKSLNGRTGSKND